jgi:hypothetical protein
MKYNLTLVTLDATGENLELKTKPKTTESRREWEKKRNFGA